MSSVFPLIEKRRSVRNYRSYELSQADRAAVQALLAGIAPRASWAPINWALKTPSPIGSGKLFAEMRNQTPEALAAYGFEGQALLLKLLEMEYGTCWMGAGRAAERGVPAVIVFGKEAPPSLVGKLSRLAVGGGKRKSLAELLTPGSLKPTGEQERILDAMRRAPSAVNRQPWRFTVRSRQSVEVSRTGGHQVWSYVDLGIALKHGSAAADEIFGRSAVTCLDRERFAVNF